MVRSNEIQLLHLDHFSVLESYTICGACPSDLIRWTVISTTPI